MLTCSACYLINAILGQKVRLSNSKDALPSLYAILNQSHSFDISTLCPPRETKIIHAGRRVWMILAQLLLVPLAFPPPPMGLDSCTSTLGWPYWSVLKDGLR